VIGGQWIELRLLRHLIEDEPKLGVDIKALPNDLGGLVRQHFLEQIQREPDQVCSSL
jgi:hypothetical protein